MKNLIELLSRYGNFILFLLLEVVCFYLIINYNKDQKEIFLHSGAILSGNVLANRQLVTDYFELNEINESLAKDNAKLIERLIYYEGYGDPPRLDSLLGYALIPCKLINNSIHLRNNNFTINAGSDQGVKKNMGVVTADGVVGIVKNVSKSYAQVLSLLNASTRVSVKLKNKGYFGNLRWLSTDPKSMTLEAIPKYANVAIGDTIVTNGYSTIFPEGIEIGYVTDFYINDGSSNYTIDVSLKEDMEKLKYVFVIQDYNLSEKQQLLDE